MLHIFLLVQIKIFYLCKFCWIPNVTHTRPKVVVKHFFVGDDFLVVMLPAAIRRVLLLSNNSFFNIFTLASCPNLLLSCLSCHFSSSWYCMTETGEADGAAALSGDDSPADGRSAGSSRRHQGAKSRERRGCRTYHGSPRYRTVVRAFFKRDQVSRERRHYHEVGRSCQLRDTSSRDVSNDTLFLLRS